MKLPIAYRPEIDGLRAIAIGGVVLYHTGNSAFSGGYIGVDVFFVISGFLITSIIARETQAQVFSFANFYARRCRRILPALLFMLTCVTVISFIILRPRELIEYGKILIYTVLFGANFRLIGPLSYFDHSMLENPLLHMWSLSVEEQFYLIWPVLLLLILTYCSLRQTRFAIAGLLALSLATSTVLVWLLPQSAFYHLPSRGWELLTGAALALGIAPRIKTRAIAEMMCALGLFLILAPIAFYSDTTPFPGVAAIPPVLGCALIIHATTLFDTRVKALLSLPPAVFAGKISYSLYLWHWPLISLAAYLSVRQPLPSPHLAGLITVAVGIAVFSWRFVELPSRTGGERLLSAVRVPSRRMAYAAGVVVAIFCGCGSFFQENRGAWWRLSPRVRAILEQPRPIGYFGKTCDKYAKSERLLDVCEIKGSAERVVVWGDSHAMHYGPAVAKAFGNETTILSRGGCSAVGGIPSPDASLCVRSLMIAHGKIQEIKPQLTVLAGRWHIYDTANFDTELRKNIRWLTGLGSKVLIMMEVPEMRWDIDKCVWGSFLLARDMSDCLQAPRSEVEKSQAFISATIATIARDYDGVYVFYPMGQLCDATYCRSERNGVLLYADGNHLTRKGALSLAESLKEAIPNASQAVASSARP